MDPLQHSSTVGLSWNRSSHDYYLLAFLLCSAFRYLRLLVNLVAYTRFRPHSLSDTPRFLPKDATVIVCTVFSEPEYIAKCVRRMLSCGPARVICVTSHAKIPIVNAYFAAEGLSAVVVLGVNKLNKRKQMLKGLQFVDTGVTIFADDDVRWPNRSFLEYLLSAFDKHQVGAVGPRQRVHRNDNPSMWNFLGICYIERRNFNTGSTNNIDGGISTLSGRTQAVRTDILKNAEFFHYFQNDRFLDRPLLVDDDKSLTRYIYSKGWEIALNFAEDTTIETTLEDNARFIDQCKRWARGHFRGNFTVMVNEDYWYKRHLWTLYAVYIAQFQTPAILVDSLLFWLLYRATHVSPFQALTLAIFATWVLFTKVVKIIPHLRRHPADIKFLPIAVLFSYAHGIINIWALLTLHKTIWGSRQLEDELASHGETIFAAVDAPSVTPPSGVDSRNGKVKMDL